MTSPKGFLRAGSAEMAEARWEGGQWIIAETPVPDGLTDTDVAGLRDLRGIHIDWPSSAVPLDVILQLAAAGVPLHSETTPGWLTDDPLAALVTDTRWLQPETDSAGVSVTDLRREEHSVRLRRRGLLHDANAVAVQSRPVSVVVASKRPWLAGATLEQIARQRHVNLEVIFAAHGFPADVVRQAAADQGFPFPIQAVELTDETVFGDVLNEAVRRASGDYIAKWDDDDWYGPDYLSDLLLAKAYSGADLVGTSAEYFYLEPLNLTIRRAGHHSEIVSTHVAGGTILLERTGLASVGGFEPVPTAVDGKLLAAVDAAGGSIYRTHGLAFLARRSPIEQHTWRSPLAAFVKAAANQWRGFRPTRILEGS
ncbi:hypothetical protein GCM10023194_65790 [Planotetraspora phitsanulokensis]|uniref:Glycosyltransferase 2-like domain-containing protein n=1 Tax=Planotetraspora phitsanulokensis TaxID=575192 RepID=A0A8J3U9V4_9ACTN|nr:glycosyltransferase family 2 protein [Planotetraspora phitsanulokensis]GII38654.1 hypothetical protein Pph01_36570 [Planotetraspora phitsanulokensis]